jgi:transposase
MLAGGRATIKSKKLDVAEFCVSDEFWAAVEPMVPVSTRPTHRNFVREAGGGRKAKPARLVFEAIIYVLRTGCPWKALPSERFGSASAIHKRYQDWERAGLFETLWNTGLAQHDAMQGIAWSWRKSVDPTPNSALKPHATPLYSPPAHAPRVWRPHLSRRTRATTSAHQAPNTL